MSQSQPQCTEQETTLGEAKTRRWWIFLGLRNGCPVYGRVEVDTELVPLIRFRSAGFEATVRPIGPIGDGVYFPEKRQLREFIPETSGEYVLDDGEVHPADRAPTRGLRRKAVCLVGFHEWRSVGGYPFQVRQCLHCLCVERKRGPSSLSFMPATLRAEIEACANAVRSYDGKYPLPSGLAT